jgi:hypothetical protein
MPRRHDVLLPLGRRLLVSLSANGLLVLVGGQHDPDAVFLASLARRAGHFQAVARFAASFLCSGIQREVLGDILRYLKAVEYMEGKGQNDGCLLAWSEIMFAYWGMTISSLFRRPSRMKRI